jgi:hypothetical protein
MKTIKDVEPVGDAAKMREVIDGIKNVADSALTALSIGNCQSSFLWDIVRKCDTALSAPPRNCDRFNAADEALSAYCEEKGITHPLPLWYGNEFWGLLQWLFAKAKGDAK